MKSTTCKEFFKAVDEVESQGYWVEWAPSLSEARETDVWMKFAGLGCGKAGANSALLYLFFQRDMKPRPSLALSIGGAAAQAGQLAPCIAVFAQEERVCPEVDMDGARHSKLVIEIEYVDAAVIAISKAATYLSDVFYGPEGTRVLEVWVVLISKIPPPRPAADLPAPGAEVPLGPLHPYEGTLPVGVGADPPAVLVFFSRHNELYEPAYAPVLWDHMVHVPAGSHGGGAFSANDFLIQVCHV